MAVKASSALGLTLARGMAKSSAQAIQTAHACIQGLHQEGLEVDVELLTSKG